MNDTIRWLFRVPGRKNIYIALLTLLQGLSGCTGVLYALLLKEIVDCAVNGNSPGFYRNVLLIAGFVIIQLGLSAAIRHLRELAKADIENLFKSRLLGNILRKEYGAVSATHTAEWINRLTNDTVVVSSGYADILPGLVGTVVRLISALIMIITLDRWFAYILIPGGIALLGITYLFRKTLKRLHKNIQEADGKLRIFLQEHIGSLMMLRSFTAEEQTEREAARCMDAHKKTRMKRMLLSNTASTGYGVAMQGMYLIGVIYCAQGILSGNVSYGTLTAVMQLIGQVEGPFASISGFIPRWFAMTASAERLMEIESLADDGEIKELSRISDIYENSFVALGLENAAFTYTSGEAPTVFGKLSLEIKKGEYVAFTGHSGCGKSTVLKLLMSMYPLDSGERYITCSQGRVSLDPSWRRLFAYVPQGNVLMSGSIKDIVTFGDAAHADDEERIKRALFIACADGFVDDISTVLGERGTGLSEGQMQRLAIARAVFSDRPILLLDEATSALDEATEKQVLENLRALTDKTVIIVTHRRAALSVCDREIDLSNERQM